MGTQWKKSGYWGKAEEWSKDAQWEGGQEVWSEGTQWRRTEQEKWDKDMQGGNAGQAKWSKGTGREETEQKDLTKAAQWGEAEQEEWTKDAFWKRQEEWMKDAHWGKAGQEEWTKDERWEKTERQGKNEIAPCDGAAQKRVRETEQEELRKAARQGGVGEEFEHRYPTNDAKMGGKADEKSLETMKRSASEMSATEDSERKAPRTSSSGSTVARQDLVQGPNSSSSSALSNTPRMLPLISMNSSRIPVTPPEFDNSKKPYTSLQDVFKTDTLTHFAEVERRNAHEEFRLPIVSERVNQWSAAHEAHSTAASLRPETCSEEYPKLVCLPANSKGAGKSQKKGFQGVSISQYNGYSFSSKGQFYQPQVNSWNNQQFSSWQSWEVPKEHLKGQYKGKSKGERVPIVRLALGAKLP